MSDKQPIIDWNPAPGCLLIKTVKREELAALYNKQGTSTLSMPDKMGKISDSAGVGRVIIAGTPKTGYYKGEKTGEPDWLGEEIKPGDLVGFIPYVDLLIEIDGIKYSVIEYKNVKIVRKG